MPELKILSQNVLKLRQSMGESQLDFSTNCGISTKCLSQIECGTANPRLTTLQNIAAYTNHTVSELISESELCIWDISTDPERI